MTTTSKAAYYVPGAVITGAGVVSAVYFTYKYFKNKNAQWMEDSSCSSSSYYSAEELESESEYFEAPEDWSYGTEEDILYERFDKLMEEDERGIEDAYSEMEKYYKEMSECPNFLWRYAKVHHLRGKLEEHKARVEELNMQGLKYAEKAVKQDPKNPEAHKWFAILTGMEAEFTKDTSKQIAKATLFFEHIQEALKLRPQDWELHHLLGVFEYKNAERYNPKPSKETKLFLAKCFYGLQKFDEALKYLMEALEIKVKSIHDKVSHTEAKDLKHDYCRSVNLV